MAISASMQIAILKQKIEFAAKEVLENDVAPIVKQEILNQSQAAYDAYPPEQYVRTEGLIDEDNIEVDVSERNQLTVFFNYETDDGYSIPMLLADASGYKWPEKIKERPILEWAREELVSSNKITDAFRKGLNAKNIKVK